MRLKYTTSYYTRYVFNKICSELESVIPSPIFNITVLKLKDWISASVTEREEQKKKESETEKKNKVKDAGSDSDEQPEERQIYEVGADDID